MSHWTKAKVTLKDLYLMKKVAEENGVTVRQSTKAKPVEFNSVYAGSLDAVMTLEKNGGVAGICQKETGAKGEHELIMDNFGNPLAEEFGNDCERLMQGYTAAVVEQQAQLMGGTLNHRNVLDDGTIELHIGLA